MRVKLHTIPAYGTSYGDHGVAQTNATQGRANRAALPDAAQKSGTIAPSPGKGSTVTQYFNPQGQLTQTRSQSANGTQDEYFDPQSGNRTSYTLSNGNQTDYLDPETGKLTGQTVATPNGGYDLYTYGKDGNLNSSQSFGADGNPTHSVQYDPGNGPGTGTGSLTSTKYNPDGSRQVDVTQGGKHTSYTANPFGQVQHWNTEPARPRDTQAFSQWDTGGKAPQPQAQGNGTGQAAAGNTAPNGATTASTPAAQGNTSSAPAQNISTPNNREANAAATPPTGNGVNGGPAASNHQAPNTANTAQNTAGNSSAATSSPHSITYNYDPQNHLTRVQTRSADGEQTDIYDPQSGRRTDQFIANPDGSQDHYSYNNQGNLGSWQNYDADGRIKSSVGYDPKEGNGTLTYTTYNPDGSRQVDTADRDHHNSYTVNSDGTVHNVNQWPLSADDKNKYAQWSGGTEPMQSQSQMRDATSLAANTAADQAVGQALDNRSTQDARNELAGSVANAAAMGTDQALDSVVNHPGPQGNADDAFGQNASAPTDQGAQESTPSAQDASGGSNASANADDPTQQSDSSPDEEPGLITPPNAEAASANASASSSGANQASSATASS